MLLPYRVLHTENTAGVGGCNPTLARRMVFAMSTPPPPPG